MHTLLLTATLYGLHVADDMTDSAVTNASVVSLHTTLAECEASRLLGSERHYFCFPMNETLGD